jgi:hypothetical protein
MEQPETTFVVPDYTLRPTTYDTDAFDEYPELRNRALILFREQQKEREVRRQAALPPWRLVCFRAARFLSKHLNQ